MSSNFDVQSLCGQLDRDEIDLAAFIEACTRAITGAIDCSCAGIWLFEERADAKLLRCLGIYDRDKGRMTLVPDETSAQVGPYFEALETTGHVLAVDANTHPATAGFFGKRVGKNGVRSVLASAFSINGQLFGAFTCTELHEPQHWTPVQLGILKRIGARVSLALAAATQTRGATLPMSL